MEYFKPPEFGAGESAEAATIHEIVDGPFQDAELDTAETFEVKDVEEEKRVKRRKKIDYSRFSTSEFNEVDSLLTNVEEYTSRIKEDAERYVNQIREEIDLQKSEVELELANALIVKTEAEKKAVALTREGEDQKAEIQKQAWEEGYQTGYAEGFEAFKEENGQLTANILAVLKELQGLRLSIFQEYEQQIVRLSLLIAKKIVHNEVKTEKSFVLQMLKDAMSHFEGMGSVQIKLNPEEYEFIKAHQSELVAFLDDEQVIKVKADTRIPAATAFIDTDFASVDLDLNSQFEEIETKLKECADDRKILFRPEP